MSYIKSATGFNFDAFTSVYLLDLCSEHSSGLPAELPDVLPHQTKLAGEHVCARQHCTSPARHRRQVVVPADERTPLATPQYV